MATGQRESTSCRQIPGLERALGGLRAVQSCLQRKERHFRREDIADIAIVRNAILTLAKERRDARDACEIESMVTYNLRKRVNDMKAMVEQERVEYITQARNAKAEQIRQLRQDLVVTRDMKHVYGAYHNALRDKNAVLQKEVRTYREESDNLQIEFAETVRERTRLRRLWAQGKTAIEVVQKTMKDTEDKVNARMLSLQAEQEKIRKESKGVQMEIEQRNKSARVWRRKNEAGRKKVTDLIDRLRKQAGEADTARRHISMHEGRQKILERRTLEAERKLTSAREQIKRIRQEVESAKEYIAASQPYSPHADNTLTREELEPAKQGTATYPALSPHDGNEKDVEKTEPEKTLGIESTSHLTRTSREHSYKIMDPAEGETAARERSLSAESQVSDTIKGIHKAKERIAEVDTVIERLNKEIHGATAQTQSLETSLETKRLELARLQHPEETEVEPEAVASSGMHAELSCCNFSVAGVALRTAELLSDSELLNTALREEKVDTTLQQRRQVVEEEEQRLDLKRQLAARERQETLHGEGEGFVARNVSISRFDSPEDSGTQPCNEESPEKSKKCRLNEQLFNAATPVRQHVCDRNKGKTRRSVARRNVTNAVESRGGTKDKKHETQMRAKDAKHDANQVSSQAFKPNDLEGSPQRQSHSDSFLKSVLCSRDDMIRTSRLCAEQQGDVGKDDGILDPMDVPKEGHGDSTWTHHTAETEALAHDREVQTDRSDSRINESKGSQALSSSISQSALAPSITNHPMTRLSVGGASGSVDSLAERGRHRPAKGTGTDRSNNEAIIFQTLSSIENMTARLSQTPTEPNPVSLALEMSEMFEISVDAGSPRSPTQAPRVARVAALSAQSASQSNDTTSILSTSAENRRETHGEGQSQETRSSDASTAETKESPSRTGARSRDAKVVLGSQTDLSSSTSPWSLATASRGKSHAPDTAESTSEMLERPDALLDSDRTDPLLAESDNRSTRGASADGQGSYDESLTQELRPPGEVGESHLEVSADDVSEFSECSVSENEPLRKQLIDCAQQRPGALGRMQAQYKKAKSSLDQTAECLKKVQLLVENGVQYLIDTPIAMQRRKSDWNELQECADHCEAHEKQLTKKTKQLREEVTSINSCIQMLRDRNTNVNRSVLEQLKQSGKAKHIMEKKIFMTDLQINKIKSENSKLRHRLSSLQAEKKEMLTRLHTEKDVASSVEITLETDKRALLSSWKNADISKGEDHTKLISQFEALCAAVEKRDVGLKSFVDKMQDYMRTFLAALDTLCGADDTSSGWEQREATPDTNSLGM